MALSLDDFSHSHTVPRCNPLSSTHRCACYNAQAAKWCKAVTAIFSIHDSLEIDDVFLAAHKDELWQVFAPLVAWMAETHNHPYLTIKKFELQFDPTLNKNTLVTLLERDMPEAFKIAATEKKEQKKR